MDSFLLNCKLQPRAKIVRLLHDVYTRRWLYVMLYLTVKQPSYTTSIYDCFSYFRSNNYIDIISHSHRGSYVVLPDITTTYFLLIPFLANQDVVNGKISFFLSLQTAGLLPFYWNSNYEKKNVFENSVQPNGFRLVKNIIHFDWVITLHFTVWKRW